MKTYWVEYNFSYLLLINGEWEIIDDFDSHRVHCSNKRQIMTELQAHLKDELDGSTYKDLKIEIINSYITTDYEI